MTLLLLSGRPGAGKTKFCERLQKHCGFIHIKTDDRAVWNEWGPLLRGSQSPKDAAKVRDKALALGPKAVIEWGFEVEYFGCVRQLRDAGFDAWWFDGDEEAARKGWINQWGDSPDMLRRYYCPQVNAIEAKRQELESFYGDDHIIRNVTSEPTGPKYLRFDKIVYKMLGAAGPT